MVFQGSFKDVTRCSWRPMEFQEFKENVKCVSRKFCSRMYLIKATRAEGGLACSKGFWVKRNFGPKNKISGIGTINLYCDI